MKRQVCAPDVKTENPDAANGEAGRAAVRLMAARMRHLSAPRSRDALRDYLWFCLDHVRAYNKAWNYYDGLQGTALEAEIRRATTWERPAEICHRPASDGAFADPLGLFDFDKRDHLNRVASSARNVPRGTR